MDTIDDGKLLTGMTMRFLTDVYFGYPLSMVDNKVYSKIETPAVWDSLYELHKITQEEIHVIVNLFEKKGRR